jgi:hypothetical protein
MKASAARGARTGTSIATLVPFLFTKEVSNPLVRVMLQDILNGV